MSNKHEWRRDERTGKQRRVKVEPTPIRPLPPPETAPETPTTPPPLNPAVEAALDSMGRAWVLIVGGEGDGQYRAGLVYWHDALSPHGVSDMAIDAVAAAREQEKAHLVRVYRALGDTGDSTEGGTDGVPAETSEEENAHAADD